MNLLANSENFGKKSNLPHIITVNPNILKKPTTKVLFCGTYPIGQSNGYSRVVYYISKYLGLKEDIELTIYGFQNFKNTTAGGRTDIPKNVIIHDAYATEDPKRSGFGDKEVAAYIKGHPQDIVIIFNDMLVTSSLVKDIVEKLSKQERSRFKLISYMDQVYPYQKTEFINVLNEYFDAVITFTSYWESTVRKLGLKKEIPTYFFPHGFDDKLYFPIPKKIARSYYNLPHDAFIILNLNRNQPRKRWDHTMMAFAEVVERHYKLENARPIRLMIGTAMKGFWNLMDIYDNEIKKRNIPIDVGREYISSIANPQQLTDRSINVIYNSCDIGINTCEGEGFGLCQFEHLAIGAPQVVANIGGFKEFINKNNSTLVEPKWNYYIDTLRDGIGGFAEVSNPSDFADAIWDYYNNPEKVIEHGNTGRTEIIQHYSWETVVNMLHKIIHTVGSS
jgi:glycosyltransferase involved in cell wall biosynthesis